MPRVVVIQTRPIFYPRGQPDSREYKQGEEFEASEVDAKKLVLVRAAALVDEKKKAKSTAKVEEAVKVEPVTTAQAEPVEADDTRKYRTRAMRARE